MTALLHHVAPLCQGANLGLHWVEQLADLLVAVRFQHEVGEMTFLRRLESEAIDVPLDEPNPARLEMFRRQHSSNRVQLSLVSRRTLGSAVRERHGIEHRVLLLSRWYLRRRVVAHMLDDELSGLSAADEPESHGVAKPMFANGGLDLGHRTD